MVSELDSMGALSLMQQEAHACFSKHASMTADRSLEHIFLPGVRREIDPRVPQRMDSAQARSGGERLL